MYNIYCGSKIVKIWLVHVVFEPHCEFQRKRIFAKWFITTSCSEWSTIKLNRASLVFCCDWSHMANNRGPKTHNLYTNTCTIHVIGLVSKFKQMHIQTPSQSAIYRDVLVTIVWLRTAERNQSFLFKHLGELRFYCCAMIKSFLCKYIYNFLYTSV